jgi:hypothetical protein
MNGFDAKFIFLGINGVWLEETCNAAHNNVLLKLFYLKAYVQILLFMNPNGKVAVCGVCFLRFHSIIKTRKEDEIWIQRR